MLVFAVCICGGNSPFGNFNIIFLVPGHIPKLRGNKCVNLAGTSLATSPNNYLLLAFMGAALFGSAIGGLLAIWNWISCTTGASPAIHWNTHR